MIATADKCHIVMDVMSCPFICNNNESTRTSHIFQLIHETPILPIH